MRKVMGYTNRIYVFTDNRQYDVIGPWTAGPTEYNPPYPHIQVFTCPFPFCSEDNTWLEDHTTESNELELLVIHGLTLESLFNSEATHASS